MGSNLRYRKRPLWETICQALSILFLLPGPTVVCQQTSPPQEPRTGRSYETGTRSSKPPRPAPQAASPVTFTDITAQTRIAFRHAASPTSQKYLLEAMGGGVALFDYDNDGRLDIYFTNGAMLRDQMPVDAQPDKREPRFWNRLYHQKPDSTFEDVTEHAGVKGLGYSFGAAAGDFDNDGFVDLYVTAYGGNVLYRNRGDGSFADVTEKLALRGSGWSTSAGWFDYDRDGRLDLFVLRYMDWDFDRGSLFCGQPAIRAFCHPDNFKPATNLIFHQKPDGTFEDTSVRSKIADVPGKGLGLAFADFDGDGFSDVFVANDSVRQALFRNNGDSTFEDVALISGAGYDEAGKTFAGMGIDAADYDNDGMPDVFITVLSNETYPLYHNNGELLFTYVTQTAGIGEISLLYSGWGTRFLDVDNDGLRDIFVAQGHVLDTIEKSTSYLKYRQPPLLMRNTGKRFVNISNASGPIFSVPLSARGAAFGDLDNDGDTDVVLTQLDGPPVILRNNGTRHHWLGISLSSAKSNRHGLGARLVVVETSGRKQTFDVSTASSYLSASDPRVLVGLGAVGNVAAVEVRWPGGNKQVVGKPGVDRYITIREP
jgi:enediyne biosynthesis protein E4